MKHLNTAIASGLMALVWTGIAAAPALAQTTTQPAASPYDKAPWWMREGVITQTGHVFAEIPANRASFSSTFLSVDDTAEKAQGKAIEQTRALQQALARLGKDAVRVTTGFSMRALYDQYRDKNGNRIEDQRGDKINGYEVSLNISIEVRDMAQLERAYALVLAASPTQTSQINFYLQPTNETNTWLYNEAIKDARKRASDGVVAAGGRLGRIKVIDPTGRACQTDILARNAEDMWANSQANEVVVSGMRAAYAPPPPPPPPPPAPAVGSAEYLEAKALANPFIQTPPLQRLEATACVVYGVE